MLVGALADRLLVARGSATGGSRPDVAQRFVGLLQPLVMGWATLVAQGLLPGEGSVLGVPVWEQETAGRMGTLVAACSQVRHTMFEGAAVQRCGL